LRKGPLQTIICICSDEYGFGPLHCDFLCLGPWGIEEFIKETIPYADFWASAGVSIGEWITIDIHLADWVEKVEVTDSKSKKILSLILPMASCTFIRSKRYYIYALLIIAEPNLSKAKT
jgi:hypothetical protein